MLKKLKVSNFALIEDIELDLKDGFTVITGETGAGKSILIDAISYVLGTKFNREFIRTGEDTTKVVAVFDTPKTLEDKFDSSEIILERHNSSNGKIVAKINNEAVTVSDMKAIAPYLLDIHGQHNNQNLLNPETHIDYLDLFMNIDEIAEYKRYKTKYAELKDKEARLFHLTKGNERDKLIDYLHFQIEEIKKAQVSEDEEKELLEKSSYLNNSQKIGEALNISSAVFNDEENNIVSSLRVAIKNLESIIEYIPDLKNTLDSVNESYYSLEEAARAIERHKDNVYFNQNELDEVNSRLFTYHDIKKKYGENISDVLEFLDDKEKELYELENREELISKLTAEITLLKAQLLDIGNIISKEREKASEILSKKVNSHLKEVGLAKADFKPYVIPSDKITERGIDSVIFMISTNTGEPRKPLEKIVSGGELSRIMLALKSVFIDKDNTPTVIFDEIDTGISGKIAEEVGRKMYSISKKCQVLCVTHLPQIAAYSDNHFIAKKEEKNGRTFSRMKEATRDEKVEEIAKMLAGSKITQKVRDNAEEMLKGIENK